MSSYEVCSFCHYITSFGHARNCSQYTPPTEDEEIVERAFVVRGLMSGKVRDEIAGLLIRLDAEGKQIARIAIEILDPSISITKSQEIMDSLFPLGKQRDVLPVELIQAMVEFCDNVVPALLNALWMAGARARAIELAKRIKELRGPTYKWPEL